MTQQTRRGCGGLWQQTDFKAGSAPPLYPKCRSPIKPPTRTRPWHFAQPRRELMAEDLTGELPSEVLRELLVGAE